MFDVFVAQKENAALSRVSRFAARALSFVAQSHKRACAVLLLLALINFLPGFWSLQPMDRDEPRFAQASKQMLETRDFIDIRFQDEARHKKPVGIYWLQSASVAVAEAFGFDEARTTIAIYRIPSLLGALATVLLTYWAALAFAGRREAFLAAAFMATSIILIVEAHLAKTDAVLAACAVAVMGALARAFLRREDKALSTPFVFWLALACGILIKGPMVVMFATLCVMILSIRERSARWLLALRPLWGGPLLLLLTMPWFVAIALKSEGAFFGASVGHDMLGKVGTAQTQHWAPPGTYSVVFFATFWPAAILTAIAANFAVAQKRDEKIAFLLAWVIPSWLIFEIVPTKLPHYVMPLYPALAILTVIALFNGAVGPHRPFAKLATLLIPLIPLVASLTIGFAFWRFEQQSPPLSAMIVLALSILLAFIAWFAFLKKDVLSSVILSLLASVMFSMGALGLAQPDLKALKLSPRLAKIAHSLDCPNPQIATLGYREPSLIFLVGTDLELLEKPSEAADFIHNGPCRMVFVEKRFEPDFQQALNLRNFTAPLSTRVQGFNINGGKILDIGVYAVKP
jgi:4-amino-4-deoxy-L-arabinose transferase-like glycosyltransferase